MESKEHGFKAEVQQLLNLMIHSVYSDREVFLRELISNAADALDKVRFVELTETDLVSPEGDALGIRITVDEDAKCIVLEDDGVGMTAEEAVQNLGTIAHSGTKSFVDSIKGKEGGEAPDLIGQFGIGFYSAFMVARQVIVESKAARPGNDAIRWVSEGAGTYEMGSSDREHRGTRIEIHLRHDADEFANAETLDRIVKRYSNFVTWPIHIGEDQANSGKALWAEQPANVTDEEANEFYRAVGMDWQEPAYKLHANVDSPFQYSAMLFVPSHRPYDLFHPNVERGPRLYARRVLITEHAKDLLPEWLRFVKGVVDSEDISLNVSREMVQKTPVMRKISDALTKKLLKDLGKMANKKGDGEKAVASRAKFDAIWENFGVLFKEGYYHSDDKIKNLLLPLLRVNTLKSEEDSPWMSLQAYKDNMPEGQDTIWFITATDREAALQAPALEAFKSKDWDVVLFTDPVDEWLMMALTEFDGVPLKSVTRGSLELDEDESSEDKVELEGLVPWMEELYAGRVSGVRASSRLTESACVLVDTEDGLSSNMERILKAANQAVPDSTRVLEVNPKHPLIRNLADLHKQGKTELAQPLVALLLDDAQLVDGSLKEPVAMGRRLQDLLVEVSRQALQ
jgi:molecular chaperone HtpG